MSRGRGAVEAGSVPALWKKSSHMWPVVTRTAGCAARNARRPGPCGPRTSRANHSGATGSRFSVAASPTWRSQPSSVATATAQWPRVCPNVGTSHISGSNGRRMADIPSHDVAGIVMWHEAWTMGDVTSDVADIGPAAAAPVECLELTSMHMDRCIGKVRQSSAVIEVHVGQHDVPNVRRRVSEPRDLPDGGLPRIEGNMREHTKRIENGRPVDIVIRPIPVSTSTRPSRPSTRRQSAPVRQCDGTRALQVKQLRKWTVTADTSDGGCG